jgi:hypothetical protein
MTRCASCGGRPLRYVEGGHACRVCLVAWRWKLEDARDEWARIEVRGG